MDREGRRDGLHLNARLLTEAHRGQLKRLAVRPHRPWSGSRHLTPSPSLGGSVNRSGARTPTSYNSSLGSRVPRAFKQLLRWSKHGRNEQRASQNTGEPLKHHLPAGRRVPASQWHASKLNDIGREKHVWSKAPRPKHANEASDRQPNDSDEVGLSSGCAESFGCCRVSRGVDVRGQLSGW